LTSREETMVICTQTMVFYAEFMTSQVKIIGVGISNSL